MKSVTRLIARIVALLTIASAFIVPPLVNAFQEGWESSPIGTYVPTSDDTLPLGVIPADEGYWLLGDTVSSFPECGATPHTAVILSSGSSRCLRLTSNDSNSSCADNVWVNIFEVPQLNLNLGFSVSLTSDTIISFEETGNLISPEKGSPYCVNPPCGDTVSLTLEDNRGNVLAYVLQRASDAVPNEVHSFYREVFLDPDAGAYSRNLFADFNKIPDFNPSGAAIRAVKFEVNEHGAAIIDNICIGTSGCAPLPLVIVPDVVGLMQSSAEAAIIAADLSVGTLTTQNSDTVPAGVVIIQSPAAGTQVSANTEVDLVISAGPFILADFSAEPRIGIVPLRVNFTDKSTGNITSWNWSLGDGTISTVQNPSHTYTTVGMYSVSLTVSGPDGSGTKYDRIFAGFPNIDEYKIVLPDGAANDRFGFSVSISGAYVIIGATGDDGNKIDSGSAYIFEKSASGWTQVAKLTASDGTYNDRFGWSVSISGDYAIVGATGDDDRGNDSGSAYIFKKSGSSWNQVAKLTASYGSSGDLFGYSVSIFGDYAVVGATGDDAISNCSGAAYIFERSGSTWKQVAKLTASDGGYNDYFGWSVSISGDCAIVGASRGNYTGEEYGSAYIFEKSDSSWKQVAKLTASDGTYNDRFGWSVSISGSYAIVGATGDDERGYDSGAAYIFERIGNGWNHVAKLTASDGDSGDSFGCSVSISEGFVTVGAWWDEQKGIGSGSAYIFEKGGSCWNQAAKLTASDGAFHDSLGRSVSISGGLAIVSADGDDDKGNDSGSVYVFNLLPAYALPKAIIALQVISAVNQTDLLSLRDINNDGRIGLAEAIYELQTAAGLR